MLGCGKRHAATRRRVKAIAFQFCVGLLLVIAPHGNAASRPCDLQFSLQNDKLRTFQPEAFGFSNHSLVIGGYALRAGRGETLASFLRASSADIEVSLKRYLDKNPTISPGDLVVLDLEPGGLGGDASSNKLRFRLPFLGELEPDIRDEVILAYRKRAATARRTLTDVKLGLYGVVIPLGKGYHGNQQTFAQRMIGYRRAGQLGLFDSFDYLIPSVYPRFGPADESRFDDWEALVRSSTRQAVEATVDLIDDIGEAGSKIGVAPMTTFWVFNGKDYTRHYRRSIPKEALARQVSYLFSFARVNKVLVWLPGEKPDMVGPVDMQVYGAELRRQLRKVCE